MPISHDLLKERVNSHILVRDSKTPMDAFTALKTANGAPWWSMVIERPNSTWDWTTFRSLNSLAAKMGPDFFTIPIADLPIHSARLSTREQASLDDKEALQLAEASSDKALIITNRGQFAGIVVVTNDGVRAGDVFPGPLAYQLHGLLANQADDSRANYEAKAPPPTCPFCGRKSYQGYNLQTKTMYCLACKRIV